MKFRVVFFYWGFCKLLFLRFCFFVCWYFSVGFYDLDKEVKGLYILVFLDLFYWEVGWRGYIYVSYRLFKWVGWVVRFDK